MNSHAHSGRRQRPRRATAQAVALLVLFSGGLADAAEPEKAGTILTVISPMRIEPVDAAFAARTGISGMIRSVSYEPYSSVFTPIAPKDGNGIVHARAMAATRPTGGGAMTVALDAESAESPGPDLLRLNVGGGEDFSEAPTVKLRSLRIGAWSVDAHSQIDIAAAGLRGRASVSGRYFRDDAGRHLSVTVLSALRGQCKIDGRRCCVRVVDCNSNLRYDDAVSLLSATGDAVIVTELDADGNEGGVLACAALGQPLWLDGAFYLLTPDRGSARVSASKLAMAPVAVTAECDQGYAVLAHEDFTVRLDLRDGRSTMLPAGRYLVTSYSLTKGRTTITCSRDAAAIELAPGDRPREILGGPLSVSVASPSVLPTVSPDGRQGVAVEFNLEIRDRNGARVTSSTRGDKIVIRNAGGEIILRDHFAYG